KPKLDAGQGQLGLGEAGPHLEGVLAGSASGLEVAASFEPEALLVVDVLVERLRRGMRQGPEQQAERCDDRSLHVHPSYPSYWSRDHRSPLRRDHHLAVRTHWRRGRVTVARASSEERSP